MTGKKRVLSAEEARLWRRVAAGVKSRRATAATELEPPMPELAPAQRRQHAAPPTVAKKLPRAAPAPIDRGGERKIRRGQVEIAASLDLHGHTQASALAALERFLHREHERGSRVVLVVTGLGRGGGEGVLRKRLPSWIELDRLKPLVSGFAQAHRGHGGAGACYVFLRRK